MQASTANTTVTRPSSSVVTPANNSNKDKILQASSSAAATAVLTKEQKRNDNSNPQQGTESPPTPTPVMAVVGVDASSAAAAGAPGTVVADAAACPSPSSGPCRPIVQTAAEAGSNNNQARRATLKIPPTKKDSRKLFVGGLPSDITDDEFRTFFAQFGELMDSIVMFDRETNRSRGFGFVSYNDPAVAQKLLETGNNTGAGLAANREDLSSTPLVGRMEMRGKMIEIKAAEPKEATTGEHQQQHDHTRPPQHHHNQNRHHNMHHYPNNHQNQRKNSHQYRSSGKGIYAPAPVVAAANGFPPADTPAVDMHQAMYYPSAAVPGVEYGYPYYSNIYPAPPNMMNGYVAPTEVPCHASGAPTAAAVAAPGVPHDPYMMYYGMMPSPDSHMHFYTTGYYPPTNGGINNNMMQHQLAYPYNNGGMPLGGPAMYQQPPPMTGGNPASGKMKFNHYSADTSGAVAPLAGPGDIAATQ